MEVFDATDVSKNVMRFVVYILWLKGQPDSFKEYLRVRERRSICGETAFINFGDYEEKLKQKSGAGAVEAHMSRKIQGSYKVENKTLLM